MNSGNVPVASQPTNSSAPSAAVEPWKYMAPSAVSAATRQKPIITGLRPMRSDSHGAPNPDSADANPRTLSSEPMAGPGMPRTVTRYFGRNVQPITNHPTMNTEIRQQTNTLRTDEHAKQDPGSLSSAGGLVTRARVQRGLRLLAWLTHPEPDADGAQQSRARRRRRRPRANRIPRQ